MAKFEINFLTEYTNEALLKEIRRVAGLLPDDSKLTQATYQGLSPRVSASVIRRRFGGWKEALEHAGLGQLYVGKTVSTKMRSKPGRGLSDADLLAEMKRVYVLLGCGWLTRDEFNAHSSLNDDTIRRRFGSFRNALVTAGIPGHPGKAKQHTDEQCFENIVEVWTHYGRPPTYREMFGPPSMVQGKTYIIRWGTWRRALKAFIDWQNADQRLEGPDEQLPVSNILESPITSVQIKEPDSREVRPGLRFKVFQRDRFRCVACGRSPALSLGVELHADHILAVANGGKTSIENLQTLCRECNLGKGRMLVG